MENTIKKVISNERSENNMDNVGFKVNRIKVASDGVASVTVKFDGAKKVNKFTRKFTSSKNSNGESIIRVMMDGCKVLYNENTKKVESITRLHDVKGRLSSKSLRNASKGKKKTMVTPKAIEVLPLNDSKVMKEDTLEWRTSVGLDGSSRNYVDSTKTTDGKFITFLKHDNDVEAILYDEKNFNECSIARYDGANPQKWMEDVVDSFGRITGNTLELRYGKTSKDVISDPMDSRITDDVFEKKVYYGNTIEETVARANGKASNYLTKIQWLEQEGSSPFHLWDNTKAEGKRFSNLVSKYIIFAD